jgi:glycosyltransferase involved in cell wall biosynthesis
LKVAFVINSLHAAGAERMLLKLVSSLPAGMEPLVISLAGGEDLLDAFRRTGAEVWDAGLTGPATVPSTIVRLIRLLRAHRPAVVSTWLYHSDLLGGVAARAAGIRNVAWNIRNSDLSPIHSSARTLQMVRFNARLSRYVPKTILCCSEVARKVHIELGFDASRFRVIPNGFDLGLYLPESTAGQSLRQELGIPADAPLIGLIARWSAQKNHHGFVKAAGALSRRIPKVHFVLAGSGVTYDNAELAGWIGAAGLRDSVHLLGYRADIPHITAALDVATSTSTFGEAFPNVLGEAMACEVPCVTTDVGDAAYIVGDTGVVVPPSDPSALAAGWERLLSMSPDARRGLGKRARERVSTRFDLAAVARRYVEVYEEIAQ